MSAGGLPKARRGAADQAIEWAKRCPAADGDVLEIRRVYEASEFGPEVAWQEASLLDEIGKRVDENKKRAKLQFVSVVGGGGSRTRSRLFFTIDQLPGNMA